jgi:hypothetical protein
VSGELDLRHPDFEVIGVRWSPTGLEIVSDLSYDDAESVGVVLSATVDAGKWGLADLIEYAEARWGESRYSQLAAATGRSVGGLRNILSVARRVPRGIRDPRLSFSHHEEIAVLSPDVEAQKHWLGVAVEYRLTIEELRAQVSATRGITGPVMTAPPVIEGRSHPHELLRTPDDPLVVAARAVVDFARPGGSQTAVGFVVAPRWIVRLRKVLDEMESE